MSLSHSITEDTMRHNIALVISTSKAYIFSILATKNKWCDTTAWDRGQQRNGGQCEEDSDKNILTKNSLPKKIKGSTIKKIKSSALPHEPVTFNSPPYCHNFRDQL